MPADDDAKADLNQEEHKNVFVLLFVGEKRGRMIPLCEPSTSTSTSTTHELRRFTRLSTTAATLMDCMHTLPIGQRLR